MIIYWKSAGGIANLMNERYQLGEISFKNFWTKSGWPIFQKMLNDPLLDVNKDIEIFQEDGSKMTAEEFIHIIEKLNIIQ